jgi:hypothetical protein
MQFLRLSSALLAGLLSSWAAHPSDKLLNPSNLPLNGILYSSFEKGTLVDQAGAWAMTAHIAGTLADAMFVSMSGETYIGTNSRVYLVVEHAFASAPGGLMDRTDYGKWLLLFTTDCTNTTSTAGTLRADTGSFHPLERRLAQGHGCAAFVSPMLLAPQQRKPPSVTIAKKSSLRRRSATPRPRWPEHRAI